jgi:hypothetical protein
MSFLWSVNHPFFFASSGTWFGCFRGGGLYLGSAEPGSKAVDHGQDAPVSEDASNQNAFAGEIDQHQPNEHGQQTLAGQNQHGQAAQ